MGKKKDLIGLRVGKLIVIGRGVRWNGAPGWLCKCDCGNTTCVETNYLTAGLTRSCGCSNGAKNKEATRKAHLKHGDSGTRLHTIYMNMKSRCANPKDAAFQDYGGRGIKVCEEWLGEDGYTNFKSWALANGYAKELTIDRVDNNSGYSPQNCRWVDMKVQTRNKRSNHWVTHNGETKCLTDWAIQQGINPRVVTSRLWRGWTEEEALGFVERNIVPQMLVTANGKTNTVAEWSAETGIPEKTIKARIRNGWSDSDAVNTPNGMYRGWRNLSEEEREKRMSVGDFGNASARTLTLNEKTMTAADWAREVGLPYKTLMARLDRGWSDERALTTPLGNNGGKKKCV